MTSKGIGKTSKRRVITTQAQMDKAIYGICNILRRDKCKGAKLYVGELTWMLFLKYLDLLEAKQEKKLVVLGTADTYTTIIPEGYRWRDWAVGEKREALKNQKYNGVLKFVNDELFPFLRELGDAEKNPSATPQQKVIAQIFRNKEKTLIASETNLLDALDQIEELAHAQLSDKHMFPISQAFEGLLPRMGDQKNDGGQFFTPREIIRVIIKAVNPKLGKTVYDPACGTGGFLIEAFKHMMETHNPTGTQIEELKKDTFYGREDADEAIPICLANSVLHGIDLPHIWHGNTLTGSVTDASLFEDAPAQFDYIFSNPPFGSKEGKTAQARFEFQCNKAQILFLQHILSVLNFLTDGGTCGMVIDEGVLFHTKTAAFTLTKKKLLNECNLWCVISLPAGVFVNAGANVKTDLLFFTKGQKTETIWFYDITLTEDMQERKMGKRNPITVEEFDDFFHRLSLPPDDPERNSTRSWTIDFGDRKRKATEAAKPFKQEAKAKREELEPLKEQLKVLKKLKQEDSSQYKELEQSIKALSKATSELEAKAKAIEEAVYDIKAVNPSAPDRTDKRTSAELIQIIQKCQVEIAAGLEALQAI